MLSLIVNIGKDSCRKIVLVFWLWTQSRRPAFAAVIALTTVANSTYNLGVLRVLHVNHLFNRFNANMSALSSPAIAKSSFRTLFKYRQDI
jgi:hypothetical protein